MDVITLDWIESFWWRDNIGEQLWDKCKIHIAWNSEKEPFVSIGAYLLAGIKTQEQFRELVKGTIRVEI